MAKRISNRFGLLAFVFSCALSPMAASADQTTLEDLVVSQDARFHLGQLLRPDQVPAGIRTITYAQYVAQQRSAVAGPRVMRTSQPGATNWSIGVFR